MSDFESSIIFEILDEIQDHLESLEALSEKMKKEESLTDSFNEIFRLVHSVKGNAKAAGIDEFSQSVHLLEDLLLNCKNSLSGHHSGLVELIAECSQRYKDELDVLIKNLEAKIDLSLIDEKIKAFSLDALKEEGPKDYHFLIIDDETGIHEVLTDMVGDLFSTRFSSALDGEEGFEVCEKEKLDIIFTDYKMPKMNGQEFLTKLRNGDSINAETPVIFMTGFRPQLLSDEKTWKDVFFVDKPFDIKGLNFHIKCALKSRKTQ